MSVGSLRTTPRGGSISKRTASIKRRAVRCVPQAAKAGFNQGRGYGRTFVEYDLGYGFGAAFGFAFGVAEVVVEVMGRPVNGLLSGTDPA